MAYNSCNRLALNLFTAQIQKIRTGYDPKPNDSIKGSAFISDFSQ